MRLGKKPNTTRTLILGFLILAPWACNSVAGIESGRLGLCADGSRMDKTNCEDAGAGGGGSSNGDNGEFPPCAAPWQRQDPATGRCYLQEYTPREWASAEQRCLELGGHLVAIDSAAELAQLGDWVPFEVWIGGTDAATEGVFVWTNGQPWSFAAWKDGFPVDLSGARDCVLLAKRNDNWPVFDCLRCTEKRGYICESPPNNP